MRRFQPAVVAWLDRMSGLVEKVWEVWGLLLSLQRATRCSLKAAKDGVELVLTPQTSSQFKRVLAVLTS